MDARAYDGNILRNYDPEYLFPYSLLRIVAPVW